MFARRSLFGFRSPEKRLFRLFGFLLGLAAGLLMILGGGLVPLVAGLLVLLASVSIFRGSATMGGWFNIVVGILVLVVPGGAGQTEAVLAIVSGALGLAGAGFF